MLSQQIKDTGSLLDSVEAIRNWRAVCLLLVTFVAVAVLVAAGGWLAQTSFVFLAFFMLLAYGVLFYGSNAVGLMMMDEARGLEARPVAAAVATALGSAHRLIFVLLLMGVLYLAGFLVLALVLFICKIPVLGPVLYTVVFPVSVLVMGVAMFALPTVIFPLSAPAVWNGATVMGCISELVAIARKRLVLVLLMMVAVAFIAGAVGFLAGAIVFSGTAVTALLSVPILGVGGGMDMGHLMMMGPMAGLGGMGGGGGHAVAAMLGGGALFAAAATLPGMVYLRGACLVYLRAIDGLDVAAEQAALKEKMAAANEKMAAAKARAQEMAAQAQASAQQYAQRPATPAKEEPSFAPTQPPVDTAPTPPAAPAQRHCPQCTASIQPGDQFCGECGHKLS